jgi:deoxycytidylate deaminase
MNSVIIACVPVLHTGYLKFFEENPVDRILLIEPKGMSEVKSVAMDLRALPAEVIAVFLRQYLVLTGIQADVRVATPELLQEASSCECIMPDEDVSRFVAESFLIESVVWKNIFLRWNWGNVTKEVAVDPDVEVSREAWLQELMGDAQQIAQLSSDWWRQIGTLLLVDGKVVLRAHNKHYPSEHTPYIVGDPRTSFSPGERIELSSAHHAEKGLIASAARLGIKTLGASMVVSTFPCPGCAMDIVVAGITTVYYSEGYSLVGAQEILKVGGVRVVRVLEPPPLT